MSRPILEDAFGHHVWATLRLMDACAALAPEQLATTVPGTYGSIIETLRHLVGSDTWYLFRLSRERTKLIDEEGMSLADLRAEMDRHGPAWAEVVGGDLDPDDDIVSRSDDGGTTHAPAGIRLAQVIHHGTDHRSQVCTALTTLGIEPPAIDAWDYSDHLGRLVEVPPPS